MATSNVLGVGPQTVVQPHRTYGERTVPMKVLCLGYGRTGTRCKLLSKPRIQLRYGADLTIALRDQLLTLGFHHSYHTFDAIYRDFYDCKLWMDLLEAKYDRGEKPSREDFDKLLGHCQVNTLFFFNRHILMSLNRRYWTCPLHTLQKNSSNTTPMRK